MSAETGHTPGPWDADGWMDNGNHSISASGGAVVCEVYEPENVPLIAAAPDLLDALRMTERTITQMAPWSPDVAEGVGAILGIARAAIAKAEAL